ncbi:hypothetical protein [Clostridium senegalense]|uniref:hypothetical protein n=1 Tax=Clostridium senegalense TaxID=1465809 RepID=UPI00028A04FE|nr:hypothetical protein [Clostridium senegalense]
MGRFLERIYPYGISVVIGIIILLTKTEVYKVIRLEFILNSSITFSSTYIGFVITAITVLVGLTQKPIMKFLNKKKFLDLIVEYFMASIMIGTLVIIYSLYLGYSVDNNCIVSKVEFAGFVMIFLSFLLCLIRVASFLMKIFLVIQYEEDIFNNNGVEEIDPNKPFSNNIISKKSP